MSEEFVSSSFTMYIAGVPGMGGDMLSVGGMMGGVGYVGMGMGGGSNGGMGTGGVDGMPGMGGAAYLLYCIHEH